ncbi:hypothetical protein [Idiomarina sp. HP20-50]|uniref:hypothetical protein n=1 Tax=Idiomarina sp. HP20-50 TaxID=3070813 RepID=UPI00294AAB40|nr:hypothetical protein [Idiomarina sp. HP20-50]MDV6315311.1 hypothetical protein [Idiomarina sp. HP20-50]
MIVEADRNASVSVENTFEFGVLISQVNENMVEISSRYEVGDEHIAPSVVTKLGQEASVSIGNKSFSVLVEKPD